MNTSPRVTLEQWRTLQAVVDHGGFAQAAEHLHRSQSSVSYAIAKLQDQLGIKLLYIDGRKARLTEAGLAMLMRARQLTDDAVNLEQMAAQLKQGWEPEIQLVIDAAFPCNILMQVLRQFAQLQCGTRVQLKEVILSGADEALLQGEADLVIGAHVPSGYLGDILIDIEFVAVAHPSHQLHTLDQPITNDDLRREMQVVIMDSGIQQKRDIGWLGAGHRWTVSSMETAVTAISNGLGFGWLPRHQIEDKLKRGLLKELPLREGKSYRANLYLIHGKTTAIGPATQKLVDIFHNALQHQSGR